jgi:hypothetical protein
LCSEKTWAGRVDLAELQRESLLAPRDLRWATPIGASTVDRQESAREAHRNGGPHGPGGDRETMNAESWRMTNNAEDLVTEIDRIALRSP